MQSISGSMQQRFLGADAAALTVIDVDAHFEPGDEWLLPYPDLARRLPKLDPGALAQRSAAERAAFAGGTMAEVFARMGQPLV